MTRQEILAVAKPILFNTDMVRAILDGRKTATRRVIMPQPTAEAPTYCYADTYKKNIGYWHDKGGHRWKPPYHAGDYLYVRETWVFDTGDSADEVGTGCFIYKADEQDGVLRHWCPSIHMPKEAARIFLRVTEVQVERLRDIDDAHIAAEGIRAWSKDGNLYKYAPADREGDAPAWPWAECPRTLKGAMNRLWDSTIKPADLPVYGWEANPWVWVIEFERITLEEV